MPGKQMSIDGDLRAGSITVEQAAMRREMVQHESKLYGSMDGAMKFVKGDAIASIIVILVNIFGGMAIGVMHEGMSASEALSTYSILSVGDGLVAQIPALLISITAGVLVTRVPGVNGNNNLATELFTQLGSRSMPLLIASAVLTLFACIPGFPAAVFLPMSVLITQKLFSDVDISWLNEEAKEKVLLQGDTAYECGRGLAWCMEVILERNAKEFIGVQETRYLMDAMESNYSELVKELQRQVQLNRVSDVLQRLVDEGVSIRDLRTIFETLIIWSAKEKDIVTLTEYVRVALKRQIVNRQHKINNGKIWIIGSNIESLIRESIRQSVAGAYSALDSSTTQTITDKIAQALEGHRAGILLTAIDTRRYLRKMIESDYYRFSVLSFMEVSDVNDFDVMGGIDLIGEPS